MAQPWITILGCFLGFILGIGSAIIIAKINNRTVYLKKKIYYQRVGMATQSPTWGKVDIFFNNEPVNNLHFLSVEIKNDTTKDLKDLKVEFSVEGDCRVMNHYGVLNHNTIMKELLLDDAYFLLANQVKEQWDNKGGMVGQPLDDLTKRVVHVVTHRKFDLPVFNRKTMAIFHFLIAKDSPDNPNLVIGILQNGVDLVWEKNEEVIKKRDKDNIGYLNLIFFLSLTFPIIKYSPSITWCAWLMVGNLFISYFLAWCLYYLYRVFKRF